MFISGKTNDTYILMYKKTIQLMQYKQCFIFINFHISHVNCFIPINNLQFYNCIPTIFKCTIVFPQFQGLQCD